MALLLNRAIIYSIFNDILVFCYLNNKFIFKNQVFFKIARVPERGQGLFLVKTGSFPPFFLFRFLEERAPGFDVFPGVVQLKSFRVFFDPFFIKVISICYKFMGYCFFQRQTSRCLT